MQKNRVVKMPIIGKIKVGRKNEKGFPESLDYFVGTGNYERYFIDAFGEKPSSIEIMFLSNNFEESCNERYELRQGAKLYAYGDGDIFQIYDEQKDDYIEKKTEIRETVINIETQITDLIKEIDPLEFLGEENAGNNTGK